MSRAQLVIRNARVLDGTGAPSFEADVEVREGRIASVGRGGDAREEIDARGAVLSPGFVDTHTHDDGALLRHPGMEFKLAQGCTSVVIGNCGFSAAPHRPDAESTPGGAGLFPGLEMDWTDLAGYFSAVERVPQSAHPKDYFYLSSYLQHQYELQDEHRFLRLSRYAHGECSLLSPIFPLQIVSL